MQPRQDTVAALELRYLQWKWINMQLEKQLEREEKEYQHLLQWMGNQLVHSSLFHDNWQQQYRQVAKREAHSFLSQCIECCNKLWNQWKQLGWQQDAVMEEWRQMVRFYQENKPTRANPRDMILLERRLHSIIMYFIYCTSRYPKEAIHQEYLVPISSVLQRDWDDLRQLLVTSGDGWENGNRPFSCDRLCYSESTGTDTSS